MSHSVWSILKKIIKISRGFGKSMPEYKIMLGDNHGVFWKCNVVVYNHFMKTFFWKPFFSIGILTVWTLLGSHAIWLNSTIRGRNESSSHWFQNFGNWPDLQKLRFGWEIPDFLIVFIFRRLLEINLNRPY